jgi:hypothetical protein
MTILNSESFSKFFRGCFVTPAKSGTTSPTRAAASPYLTRHLDASDGHDKRFGRKRQERARIEANLVAGKFRGPPKETFHRISESAG